MFELFKLMRFISNMEGYICKKTGFFYIIQLKIAEEKE